MARLLIASRSMALALRLADVHDIVEHSPDQLDSLEPTDDIEAVVLDVGDPGNAVAAVHRLRDQGYDTPVLLVSGYQHEWSGVAEMGLPNVKVVPLPITRVALLQGLGYLTGTIVDLSSIPPTPVTGTEQVAAPGAAGDGAGDTGAEAAGEAAGDAGDADAGDDEPDEPPEAADDVTGEVAADGGDTAAGDGDGDAGEPHAEPHAEPSSGPVPAAEPAPAGHIAADTTPVPAAGAPSVPAVTVAPAAAPAAAAPAPPWGLPTPVPPTPGGPSPYSPAWGTPIADDDEWGPAPHLPPSTTSPLAAVPHTPHGGIRRPATPPDTGGIRRPTTGDTGRSATLDPREPPTGGLGMGLSRRRPLLAGRRGRGLRPSVNMRGEAPAEAPAAHRPQPAAPQPPAPQAPPPQRDPVPTPGEFDQITLSRPAEADPLLASALEQRLDADAAAGAVGPASGQPRTPELVRMLLERTADLYGVVDTAQVLADDVVERADADAAAVLVPDGGIWRVSAGVGLRPLERRLILDDTHWMITEIASTGRAVLVEDTDIVRQQLAGAPLAAWRHLLAVPVPDVRAAVILARGQEAGPFTDRDLTAVVPTVREAATLLAQALETRRLARILSGLREDEGGTTHA
jgi:hypothetical protein